VSMMPEGIRKTYLSLVGPVAQSGEQSESR
jgi:hypothetical protein